MYTIKKNLWNSPRFFFDDENVMNTHNQPATNIYETETGFVVELAVFGWKKEDFKIDLENDLLTISASKTKEENESKEQIRYTKREFKVRDFKRSFKLSKVIDSEKIEANYENGILALQLPKKEEALPQPAREITVA